MLLLDVYWRQIEGECHVAHANFSAEMGRSRSVVIGWRAVVGVGTTRIHANIQNSENGAVAPDRGLD